VLLSGDIGVGFDKNDHDMAGMVDRVWNTLRSINSCCLDSVDPTTGQTIKRGIKNYIVGPHAKKMSGEGVLLKHSDVDVYYRAGTGSDARKS
jgi:hypothetical protein